MTESTLQTITTCALILLGSILGWKRLIGFSRHLYWKLGFWFWLFQTFLKGIFCKKYLLYVFEIGITLLFSGFIVNPEINNRVNGINVRTLKINKSMSSISAWTLSVLCLHVQSEWLYVNRKEEWTEGTTLTCSPKNTEGRRHILFGNVWGGGLGTHSIPILYSFYYQLVM